MKLQQLLSNRLLTIITLSYICGIFLTSYTSTLLMNNAYHFLLLSIVTPIFLLLPTQWRKTNSITLVFFFIVIGHFAGTSGKLLPTSPSHLYNIIATPQETTVLGVLSRIYSFNGAVSRFDVRAEAMRTKSTDFQSVKGNIRYTMAYEFPDNIVPGSLIAVRADLKRPDKYHTVGSFNYPDYLASQNIYVTGFIDSELYLQPLATEIPFIKKCLYIPERIRHAINLFIDSTLQNNHAAIYKALLTGDRSSISPPVLENFKRSGCMHILAISGIHMSLLGLFTFTVLFWLLRRSTWLILNTNTKKVALLCSIIPLVFYAFIAGAKTPVLRSLLMSLIIIGAVCYGRKHSFAALISCAALLLLLFSPSALFSPSFQLTFAAVIAIALVIPIITKINSTLSVNTPSTIIHKSLHWVIAGTLVSLAATVGTAPLLIYHFNRISLVGVFTNLLVEPVICLWSLILGFAAVPFIAIYPPLAEILLQIGSFGITIALSVVEFLSSIPFSFVYLPTLSIIHLIIYYLCIIFLFYGGYTRRVYKIFPVTALGFTILLIFISPAEITKKYTIDSTLTFLDVGHGSCTLIELPRGKRILIDGGGITSPGFDIGERIIAPFLHSKGIQQVDTIVITHADSDHYSGIAHILKHFKVSTLWVNETEAISDRWNSLLETAKKYGVAIKNAADNKQIIKQDDVSLRILAAKIPSKTAYSRNDNSLILRYNHGSFSTLFPGDISKQREKELAESAIDLHANILLAAHHGAASSNSALFLKKVGPEVLIVSSGKKWSRSILAPQLQKRCKELGIAMLPTSQKGSISIIKKTEDYSISTLLP